MQYNDDGTIEINGMIFHKQLWNETPQVLDNPLGGLTYIKKKTDLANRFKRFFMDYKYPKMEGHEEGLTYEEKTKLQTDFIIGLGFVSKDITKWPYYSWTHKLKLDDLKDLFIQTFENDLEEDLKKYEASYLEITQYREDMKNRGFLAKGIMHYISFKSEFTNRQKTMRDLIESIELSIGQNQYRFLASECSNRGRYQYIPEENRINSFEAMEYAKEWLKVFEPVIEELERLDDCLNFPWRLSKSYDRIPEEVLRKINLRDLTEFRYQNFLTFLMDFKQRFGSKNDYYEEGRCLTGWDFSKYNYSGEYKRGENASKWNIFNCSRDYNHTWGQWLEKMALNGEIEALSDPQTLQDIIVKTNYRRHSHNQKYKLYEKPLILVTKSEVKKEAQ